MDGAKFSWRGTLRAELFVHYRRTLEKLGAGKGLLEKNAQDTKSGAGQYFTPRPLIQAIVEAVAPQPKETICDPACGTGGFLLAAHDYIVEKNPNLTKDQKRRLREDALKGVELVQGVARLCAMNLMLHGIGGLEGEPIEVNDSLKADPGERFDIVLTNPPFGKKSSFTVVGENGEASKGRRPTSGTTSGPPPRTSSSTSCSTSRHCSA